MKDDMELRKNYKETFEEINAPKELVLKLQVKSKEVVRQEAQDESAVLTKRINGWRRIAILATAFVLLIAFSNGIVYAATGNTWIKSIVVCLNGTNDLIDMSVEERDKYVLLQGWVMGDNGPIAVMIVNDKEDNETVDDVIMHIYMSETEIVEQDGKIYFRDGDIEIDITEDAVDGEVSGIYQIEGIMKQYKARYTDEGWNVSISEYSGEK